MSPLAAFKDLVAKPLEQAMVLLWAGGLIDLVAQIAVTGPSWAWILGSLATAIVGVLVAGRLRRAWLLPIPAVLGLAVVLGVGYRLATGGHPAPAICLYGLGLWLATDGLVRWQGGQRLAALLGLTGQHGDLGGADRVRLVMHWTALVIVLLGVALAAATATPPVLATGLLVYLGLSTALLVSLARFRLLALHVYLLGAIGAWAMAILAAAMTAPASAAEALLLSPLLGLLWSPYALALILVARWATKRADTALVVCPPLLRMGLGILALALAQALVLSLEPPSGDPGWILVATLAVGVVVLAQVTALAPAPRWTYLMLLLGVLIVQWVYTGLAYHAGPFDRLLLGRTGSDQWLVLALLSLAMGALARRLETTPALPDPLYARPTYRIAWLLFMVGTVAAAVLSIRGDPWLPALWLTLLAALFPLLMPLGDQAPSWRGIAAGVLSTLGVLSLHGRDHTLALLLCAWAYALWGLSNLVLPRLNRALGPWGVDGATWPLLGVVVFIAGVILGWPSALATPTTYALGGGYALLMLRNSTSRAWGWIAVFGLTGAGLALIWPDRAQDPAGLARALFASLIWSNLLLVAAAAEPRLSRGLEAWGWRPFTLRTPIKVAGLAVPTAVLAYVAVADGLQLLGETRLGLGVTWTSLIGISLVATLLHALGWWRTVYVAQLLWASAFLSLLGLWLVALQPFPLSLLLALWSSLVLGITPSRREGLRGLLGQALVRWRPISVVATLAVLVLEPPTWQGSPYVLLTLGLLTGAVAVHGLRTAHRLALDAAHVLFVAFVHALLPIVLQRSPLHLLSWYALALALLAVILSGAATTIAGTGRDAADERRRLAAESMGNAHRLIVRIAVVEWLVHVAGVLGAISAGREPMLAFGPWDGLGAVLTAMLLVVMAIRQARHRPHWTYAIAALVAIGVAYLRVLWVGFAPFTVWDTGAILLAAYGLFLVQRLTLSQEVLHVVLVLPVLAVLTVPFQLGSTHGGLTLIAAGVLYFLTRRATGLRSPLYLGFLALNAGLFFWLPHWASELGLYQVYLIPAALSVLALLHLHRAELTPRLLNGGRLAALVTLYGAATLDVVLTDSLGVFLLVLSLSLAAIVLGIASRTRVFLYTGVIFLVIHVTAQLIELYPQHRLTRALVLMGLGAIITGAMIWLNIKREAVLRRIRIFRADLARWE